nr:MAG TPA: hypothetical protein [Caudoviricetes sp.]
MTMRKQETRPIIILVEALAGFLVEVALPVSLLLALVLIVK